MGVVTPGDGSPNRDNGVYGYYVTDKYPFAPICTFGVHEPSFGKVPPLRWDDETEDNTKDSNGVLINGH